MIISIYSEFCNLQQIKKLKMIKIKLTVSLLLLFSLHAFSQTLNIYESSGWLESAYVEWQPVENVQLYHVYYTGEGLTDIKIDQQLIRNYGGYYRADILGLKQGNYTIKITAVINGTESTQYTGTTQVLNVLPQIREGFAFSNNSIPGAYKMDGTLKDNAQILYIDNSTAKTVSLDVIIDKNGNKSTTTGISNILTIKGKGYDKTPLSVRFIGKVSKENIDIIKDNMYLNLQGSKSLTEPVESDKRPLYNTTIEGIGEDATLYGFGINLKRTAYIEIRNLGFMLWGGGGDGDAISMDTDNLYIWVHNSDFFYGETGGDADQAKGDGSIDMKYNSSNVTISFNHFWDSGKVLASGGATGETNQLSISFHHNWFDHSDSRMPRLTYTNAHVYNNYYDGAGTYGIGTSRFSSAFVENNYFRGTYRPMLIPGQGTDVWEGGTNFNGSAFTSQEGGMTKAYNNSLNGGTSQNSLSYFSQNTTPVQGQIDAYEVAIPSETIPNTVAALRGGYNYNNFDTNPNMYIYTAQEPTDAMESVKNYSGRINGGDFTFYFDNDIEDDNKNVIPALKQALENYNPYYGAYLNTDQPVVLNNVLKLYPNPVLDILNIETNLKIQSINLYTLQGQLIHQQFNNLSSLNLNSINAGTYLISIQCSNGTFSKLILKK